LNVTPMDGFELSAESGLLSQVTRISTTTNMTQLLVPTHAKVAADSVGVNVGVKRVDQ
jgi:hypothetical protein